MGKKNMQKHFVRLRLLIGIVASMGMILLFLGQFNVLLQLDRGIYDLFLRRNAGGEPSAAPAIVDLDEASLEAYGQWPWPRYLIAELVQKLADGGAAAIGLDILLSEDDRTSPVHMRQVIQRDFKVDLSFDALPLHLHDNDALLAQVMKQTPTIAGIFLNFSPTAPLLTAEMRPKGVPVVEQKMAGALSPRTHLLKAVGATVPLKILQEAAPVGAINMSPDADGIVRAVPLVMELDGNIYPSLSLRCLMQGLKINSLILQSSADGLQALRLGPNHTIPVSPSGLFQVQYRGGQRTYPYFSAKDILEGKIPTSELQGRVLIVGTSSPGLLDLRSTPFEAIYPGAEVHASTIDAILSKRFMQIPPWTPGAQMFAIGLTGLLCTLIFALASPLVYLPAAVALAGGSLAAAEWLFKQGMFLSPIYIITTIAVLATVLLAVRFWQESQHKRALHQAFSRYVAPDLVARIADRGDAVLAGEERQVTLIFTDIRGFTNLSENLQPQQVVDVLNRYFTPMTALVRGSGGTIDKFIGDAIMAFWNAPLDVEGHPGRGVVTAIKMQRALVELNKDLEQEFGVSLRMGAGVHSGKVYVGNMGTPELLDYTCIGDTVNLASRLEGLCPVYGVGIITSGASVAQCQEELAQSVYFQPLDRIQVKGKNLAVDIYYPMDLAEYEERKEEFAAFNAAHTYYIQGDFTAAEQNFGVLCSTFSRAPLYSLYRERCQQLLLEKPEHWDGVWVFTKK